MAQHGLINNQLQTPDQKETQGALDSAAQAPGVSSTSSPTPIPTPKPASYSAERDTLDPGETVEGRLTNILKSGSPLFEDARTMAAQAANRRGLINSSMAVGAGEEAVIRTALPIAQQDAQAALTVSQNNMQAGNRASEFNATSENQFGIQNLQGNQQMELQRLRGEQETGLQQLRGEQETGLQQLRGQQEMAIQTAIQSLRGEQQLAFTNLENQWRSLIQTNQSAATTFSQFSTAIAEIMREPNIKGPQKEQLINQQLQLLKNGMAVIGGIANLDLGSLLDFPSPATPVSTTAPATQPEVTDVGS